MRLAMSADTPSETRRHWRVSLPKGMYAAWYGGGDQQVSRVATLGMGGLFLAASRIMPIGTSLRLAFEVPGGVIQSDGIVRSFSCGEGMGVEFTKLGPRDRVLLGQLLRWLLR